MKNHKNFILILSIFFYFINFSASAQCTPGIIVPGTYNGINVTGAGTGSFFPTGSTVPYSSCTGANTATTPANPLYLGAAGPFTYTYTFSQAVNDLRFIITATGFPANENFIFTTNGGVPSITNEYSCFTTITSNQIISGAGATTTSGGGGSFVIKAPAPFTTITISGSGGQAGSYVAICTATIIAAPLPCYSNASGPSLN